MSDVIEEVWCGACGARLDELASLLPLERKLCLHCGSSKRHIKLLAKIGISVSLGVRAVGRAPGEKKPIVEMRAEPRMSVKLGRMVDHERTIDRRNDEYTERVTDPLTHEVIHECDEPLSEHRGHGSAKKQP